ncbi:hypothetical protein U5U50_03110 [Mycoplasma sp. 888]|uniref:hypothetical protein n=1 Tax=Mycoplasma sp. 888 TaxID=3108483 RepID=UPI002D78281C|nr:hypothetical protein [Mycoplasma sp. 888]WRQ25770.1 hypothetical protein U5U50_03110 [Mycoplasma sp. 888]
MQNKIKSTFPNDQVTQFQMIQILRNSIKTYQQMNDFSSWLERKKDTYPRIMSLFKTISKRLFEYENFTLISIKGQLRDAKVKDGFLSITQSYKNKYGEIIDININEEMKINYKIGNDYERHACEQTSEQILKALEENKQLKIINIKRLREFYGASYKQNAVRKSISSGKQRGKQWV